MNTVKKTCSSLAAPVLILAIFILAFTAFSADGDSQTYTATLKYYDNIQITYTLNYPSGGVWSGAADIPVGGTAISDQIYCVDPFVPFHSNADKSYWDTGAWATVDEKGGYVTAAPWNISSAMRQNLNAVNWLAANGYRGDYLTDDAESRASVARLQELYSPGITGIDKRIAFMATKVAIWKILAGDNVVILRTSLDNLTAQKNTFNSLVQALVKDARDGRETSAKLTQLQIKINDPNKATHAGVGYVYYGPLTVSVKLNNSPGGKLSAGNLDKVFLAVNGEASSGVSFVSAPNNLASSLLPEGKIYGADDDGQYLDVFADNDGDGVWESSEFYLKVPDSRRPVTYTDRLAIAARAMVKDVLLVQGTPVIFVYGDGDIQDWNAVQAFMGAAKDGTRTSLYAEDSINTAGTEFGQIYVSKQIENSTPLDDNAVFTFQLLYSATEAPAAGFEPVDLKDFPVHGAFGFNATDNTFTLKNGGLAMFEWLPTEYYYQVKETGVSAIYPDANFSIPVAATPVTVKTPGKTTSAFQMDDDLAMAMVSFVNIKQDIPKAHLYIGKTAVDHISFGNMINKFDAEYSFVLEYSDDGGNAWQPVVLTGDIFTSDGGKITDGAKGKFTLKTLDMAYIDVDSSKLYRAVEEYPGPNYLSMYALVQTEYDSASSEWINSSTQNNAPHWDDIRNYHITEEFKVTPGGYHWLVFSNLKIYDLSITKNVAGSATDMDFNTLFGFQLVYMGQYPEAVPLSTAPLYGPYYIEGITDDRIKTDSNGFPSVFLLKHGETATIKNLPAATYKILEQPYEEFTTTYVIDSEAEVPALNNRETDVFLIIKDARVTYKNTRPEPKNPDEPTEPNAPNNPNTPTEPNTPNNPNTPTEPNTPNNPNTPTEPDDEAKKPYFPFMPPPRIITPRSPGTPVTPSSDTPATPSPNAPVTPSPGTLVRPPTSILSFPPVAPAVPSNNVFVQSSPFFPDAPTALASAPDDRAPQTGDDNTQTANIIMLITGTVCVAGAVFYRYQRRRSAQRRNSEGGE